MPSEVDLKVFGVIRGEAQQLVLTQYRHPHGKVIPKERFHDFDETLLQQLLGFHYQQCCMKMLRGYAAGPPPCSEEQLRWA